MKGRKLLDAHVFNGRQEIAKLIVTNIVVPWIFEIFVTISLFHTYLRVKKHTLFNKFLLQKKTKNLTRRKKRRLWQKKGNYFLFAYYILGIYYSLSSIIHWIDLNFGYYSCNTVELYKKQGKLSSDWKLVSRGQLPGYVFFCIFWFIWSKEDRKPAF